MYSSPILVLFASFLHPLPYPLPSLQIQTLILLSLGSLLPLHTTFPLPSHLHIHLIDSHRPFNLVNLFGVGVVDGLGEYGPGEQRNGGGRNGAGRGGGLFDAYDAYDREGEGMGMGEDSRGRIWVWSDGGERKLDGVKKSWEALEVSVKGDKVRSGQECMSWQFSSQSLTLFSRWSRGTRFKLCFCGAMRVKFSARAKSRLLDGY